VTPRRARSSGRRCLLNQAGVAVLAGNALGRFGREQLRLSYANSLENIERALERIGGPLAGL